MKRLAGRTDLEDALKKLDKLTQEEARMAIAQNLRATQNVDDRVEEVNDKVAVLIDGTQTHSSLSLKSSNPCALDEREARVVIQQTANDIDQVKRS